MLSFRLKKEASKNGADTTFNTTYKMNEMANKFLLAGDKFMPKLYLRQPGFTYSACGPFTRNKERIQTFKETGDSLYIY